MDNYDGNPSLGGEPAMDTGDWKCQLQADSRERIVNKISETLKRHLPFSGQEGLVELKKIAVRFEEKIYAAATSQSDYLRKISLKMLTMETKSQTTVTSSLQSNSAGSSVMQPQVTNQGQLLSENIQSNIPHAGIQFSAGLSSAQAPTPALNMSALLSALPPSPGTDMPASISSVLPSPQGINMSSSSSDLFPAYGLIQSESSSALSPAWSLNVLANYPLASSHQSHLQLASLAEQLASLAEQSFRLQQNQQSAIPHLTESMLQQTAMPQQHQAQQLIATLDSTAQIGDENGAEWQEEVYQKVRCQTCKVYQKIKVMKEMYLTKLTEIYQKNAIKLEQLESLPQQPKLYRLEKLKIHKTMLEHLITVLQVSRSNISPVLKGKLGLYEKQIISFINTNKPKKPDSSLQQGQLTVPSMGHSHSHATQVQSPENQMNPQLQSMNLQSSVPTMQQNNITGLQQNSMSSLSGDSTAQTGHTNGADWQEEVYQKIKVMKEMYYPELSEMYQKIASKLHQHDSLPQQPKSEQLEKLKMFKAMLERLITVLQISKSNVSPGMKEKLNVYEKQIINFINTNRPRKPVSTLQPGQLPPPHMQSMQQSQSQINQVQSHENQMNPQLQSMNLQGSVPTMQQNNMTGLQQNSMSSLSGVSTAQQNMMNPLQPSSNMDPGQGTSLNSLQQNGINMLQNNINPLQSNPGILHSQHLKQQEQQLYQNQLKQQYQRQMQQQLMQKQQIIQQQQPQQQQLQQQAKQQLPGQLQAHQMPQLHQMSDVNDVKIRPGMGVKPGSFQQHMSVGQRAYPHQQLKSASPYPVTSSNQLLQAQSPQLSQHSSPQVDQQLLVPKAGTPLQNASSPFVIPSPSPSTPIAPSPMPGESEKPSSLSNAGNVGHQPTAGVGAQVQSLAIGTPGISASPLLAEFIGPDGTHANALSTISGKSSVTEQPLERLIKAVKSISTKALSASVSDIGSVVSMIDRIAGSAPGNGSRAAVGEDLVAMTKCRLLARNFITHDGTTNGTRKMRRYTSAMPLNVVSSGGSMNDSFKQLTGLETSDLESTATSRIKRPRIEANHALMEEIREINRRLIDTVVDISDEDVDPSAAAAERGEGTIVKCSFDAVALSPNLKSQYASAQMSPIQPLRLLVPTNYPNCSPILLDKFPVEVSKEYEDLSVKAKSRFSICLRSISQPMSLGEIARTWDICARAVISEHAQRSGGGSFSSKYGTWENCLSAA